MQINNIAFSIGVSREAPLVNITKSSSPSSPKRFLDTDTGEIVTNIRDPIAIRLERFALQSAVKRILPGSRTAKCLRSILSITNHLSGQNEVTEIEPEIWFNPTYKTSKFRKLQLCASVWQCPCCATIISERRRFELLQAIQSHKSNGGDVLLLTLTVPHYSFTRLDDLLKSMAEALAGHFYSGKSISTLFSKIGHIGHIRALEVTHGRLRKNNNGWHPHYHILLFLRSGLDLDDLKLSFYRRWSNACLNCGLPQPSFEHGLSLHDGTEAAYYAGKWGLEAEMTKGHIAKGSKQDGETPFDFLRSYLYDDDKEAAALFFEFARCFKGKRQLFWSKGLKALFQIGEISDNEAAVISDTSAYRLGSISFEDWQNVLKYDLRGELLELSRQSWNVAQDFIFSLRNYK